MDVIPLRNKPPIHKNQDYELFVMRLGFRGDGITLLRSKTVYIPNALPCDRAEVRIIKILKTFCYGKLTRILKPSHQRRIAPCPIAAQCGGCILQHQKYHYQVVFKQEQLVDALAAYPQTHHLQSLPFILGKSEFHYRNKLQVAIQRQDQRVVMGLYASRSHRVVPMTRCLIQGEFINDVLAHMQAFFERYPVTVYDEQTKNGDLRHCLIRESTVSKEAMLVLVLTTSSWSLEDTFIQHCQQLDCLSSVHISVNNQEADHVLGAETRCVYGQPFLIDSICHKRIRVSPESFLQSNLSMVESLYKTIVNQARIRPSDRVCDAYCGVGVLTLMLSDYAAHVYGVESNPKAIQDAKLNLRYNPTERCSFINDTVESWITSFEGELDVLVMDPPRQGCDPCVLNKIIEKKISRLVYCSCNPKTFARDAARLIQSGYTCQRCSLLICFLKRRIWNVLRRLPGTQINTYI